MNLHSKLRICLIDQKIVFKFLQKIHNIFDVKKNVSKRCQRQKNSKHEIKAMTKIRELKSDKIFVLQKLRGNELSFRRYRLRYAPSLVTRGRLSACKRKRTERTLRCRQTILQKKVIF